MKNTYNYILIVLSVLVIYSCSKDPRTEKIETVKKANIIKVEDNLNISFLLDLSDRIDPKKYPNPAMEYYVRDAEYIKSVIGGFDNLLRAKKVRSMDDKIQLYFEPEPLNQEINNLSHNLKFQINKNNVSMKLLKKIVDAYSTQPIEIYNLAIKDDKYVGSDIWKFFKNKVEHYCIEEDYRNILVILTDGYIYHKDSKQKAKNLTTYLTPQDIRDFRLTSPDWKEKIEKEGFGFIPATDDLSNLEILVLGINPDKKSPYEEDIIKTYWKNWFTAMKVKRFQMLNADLPSNLDKIIKDFILLNK
ncbi:hypothetical protein [uncultured Aquimarina sp.]|uniref:hypothetical protein n=1 Tax=uncultured Aquimarina sp. TaxID=575652 RepID=UPI0026024AAD|nr:hypothetical protein [uncultured Aquimarina sp.]